MFSGGMVFLADDPQDIPWNPEKLDNYVTFFPLPSEGES
jgi:hypothetical protein